MLRFTIREATAPDDEAIRRINLCAWAGYTSHDLLERRHGMLNGTPWRERIADAVAANFRSPHVTVFVAETGGRVIGYASAQFNPDGGSEVGIVGYNAVDPDFRRQGVGRALVQRVVDHLKAQGARVLQVWTLERGEPARRLYESLGFQEFMRMVHYSMDCAD